MATMPSSKRKRAIRETPDNRRYLILQAARECLSEQGRKGFTLSNVADRAEVSISLVSHYFGSAELLLQEVFQSALFEAQPRKYKKPNDLNEALGNLISIIERQFHTDLRSRKHLNIWLPIYEEVLFDAKVRRVLKKIDRDTATTVSKLISDVSTYRHITVDSPALADEFLAFLDGLWIRWCLSGRATATRELAAATRFLEASLGPLRVV